MSRQRKIHPEVVKRRKLARQIDKEASKVGYVSNNTRAGKILKLQDVRNKNKALPLEFMEKLLSGLNILF